MKNAKMVGQQFTPQERAFMVSSYMRTHSYQRTIQMFQRRFQNRNVPSKSTISRNVRKYSTHGTSRNLNQGRSGRLRTARSGQNIATVRGALRANPRSSCRRNIAPHISRASFNRIVRLDLQWHPYRIQERFALRPGDPIRRMAYAQWMVNRPPRFCNNIIVSDEASFRMNGHVNTWNLRCYAARRQPPRNFTYDVPDIRQSLNVWVGITGDNHIIGPFFIRGNVNGNTYLNLINNQVVPELQRM